jgi:hypothetical protein
MYLQIDLRNLEGRRLIGEDIGVMLHGAYRIDISEWNYPWEGTQTDLIARPRDLAAAAARELFARFGLNVSVETLKEIQQQIGR